MTARPIDTATACRWAVCGAAVLGLHLGAAATLAAWREPAAASAAAEPIIVDLAPLANVAIDAPQDAAPGLAQPPIEAPPPAPKQTEAKLEQQVEQNIEPAPSPSPAVAALPPPAPAKTEPPPAIPVAPAVTAPPRQRAVSAAEIDAWHGSIVASIERNKSYPPSAQARGERGVAQLSFAIDREGRVVASRIVHSSGFAALDQGAIATLRRAEPFPSPPAGLPGATFAFEMPVEFAR